MEQAQLTPGLAAAAAAASMHNPLFYERQRMRASTYNIPRFLYSYDETLDGGMILPRGMLDTVTNLCRRRQAAALNSRPPLYQGRRPRCGATPGTREPRLCGAGDYVNARDGLLVMVL
jgi:hypothetical protein